MSQAPQSQPVFVDIHMNNGRRVGARTFSDILNGRFHGDMQLAFEQYLGDFRAHGAAYRTYRYAIVNGNMLLLQAVLNPLSTGPALAVPVMPPGLQYPNAQTQASVYQKPYAFQPNQPTANLLGLVDPSTVRNMRYAPANTAQMSIPQPRQLNPGASEFQVGSAGSSLGASARPSALPIANLAPAYPPGLPVIQQPHFAPANAHQGYLALDHDWQLSRKNGEAASAAAGPSMSNMPYSSPIHRHSQVVSQQPQHTPFNVRPGHYGPDPLPGSYDPYRASRKEAANLTAGPQWGTPSNTPIRLTHGPTVPQQPRLTPSNPHQGGLTLNTRLGPSYNDYGEAVEAPASPPALVHNYFTASQESWMASPSPLDLGSVYSSDTDNPHLPPRQCGRHASEHSSDLSSHSSSVQDPLPGNWSPLGNRGHNLANSLSSRDQSTYHTANSSVPKANATNNTLHAPQNGETDTGIALFHPTPARQLQPRDDTDAIKEHRLQQILQTSTAYWDEMRLSDRIKDVLPGNYGEYYDICYEEWRRNAAPGSTMFHFYEHFNAVIHSVRRYYESIGWIKSDNPATTPSPRSRDPPTATVSHHAGPSTVGNGMNSSGEVARLDTPPHQTLSWLAGGISARNDVPLSDSPRPQLHHSENRNAPDRNSHIYPHPTVDAQLEAQFPAGLQEEDPRLMQRLNQHILDFSTAFEEVLTMRRDAEVASS